ncbi:hypothetical protein KIN20_020052 [Parelaphostrongylus tenuis]|uniref:Uncharacterized protein n=1 Tax=Parelaphostrongylus tenuis TaxID=148309 RepID=A0AAD5N9E0_PARTN|nr:hypothetical protein KIN20_020052 [Parelaphostrongylus tenuis]
MVGAEIITLNSKILARLLKINETTSLGNTFDTIQFDAKTFTVSRFNLPVAIVYTSTINAPAQIPGIETTDTSAQAFVSRLVKQAMSLQL